MSTIWFLESEKNFNPKKVRQVLDQINQKKFENNLKISDNGLIGSFVFVGFRDQNDDCWCDIEIRFPHNNLKRLEFSNHGVLALDRYVLSVILNDLGAEFGCVMGSDCDEETWAPVKDKWENLMGYLQHFGSKLKWGEERIAEEIRCGCPKGMEKF